MKRKIRFSLFVAFFALSLLLVSCNLPQSTSQQPETTTQTASSPERTPAPAQPPSNTDGAETVLIPGASFLMGSDAADPLADEDEMPQHRVLVDSFYLYRHEVTNAMYAECVAAGGCSPVQTAESGILSHYGDPAYADHPVVGVTWRMASAYCRWAGGRLPTEAEWELAARGAPAQPSPAAGEDKGGGIYPWGSEDPTCERANFAGCQSPPDTLAVGSLALGNSPYEAWDMSGNVWEWVQDWYAPNYYTFSPTANPIGPYIYQDEDHPLKVVRGGGLFSGPENLRAAARLGINPRVAYEDVGFRCVAAEPNNLPTSYVDPEQGEEIDCSPRAEEGEPRAEDSAEGDECTPSWYTFNPLGGSCLYPDGRIALAFTSDGDPSPEWSLYLNDVPFECGHEPALALWVCAGTAPEGYLDDTVALANVCMDNGIISRCDIVPFEHPSWEECSGAIPPERFSVSVSCPDEDDMVSVSFTFEPAITWDSVLFDGHNITASCTRVDLNHMTCTAPNWRTGDHYAFELHGTGDGNGQEYVWSPWAPLPEDCPETGWAGSIFPSCMEGLPVVEIHSFAGSVTSVSGTEGDLDCIGMAPGVQICTLEGDPGGAEPLTICFSDGTCRESDIDILTCSETSSPPFELAAGCMGTTSYLEVHTPIGASPAPQSVNMGDAALDCSLAPFGLFCTGLPGTPGLDWSTDVCFTNGVCLNNTVTIPDCGGPESVHWGWWLADVGCHNEERAYIIVQTSIEDFTGYRYNMNAAGFGCEPLSEGRVYCSFPLPGPDHLQFCLTPPGDDAESTCTTLDDYASRAPVSCVTPEPPEPTCSSYTNPSDCTSNGCNWDKQTSTCSDP